MNATIEQSSNRAKINKKAFTLAEVLITLAVIGVVAALAIPALLTSTNKKENYVALKKAYAALSQAAMQIRYENGGDMSNYAPDPTSAMEAFAAKMSAAKKCYDSSDTGECYLENTEDAYSLTGNNSNGGYLGGSSQYYVRNNPKFLNNDGLVYWFSDNRATCNGARFQKDGENQYCGEVWVDINGGKKPNKAGKDIFLFEINKYSINPRGNEYSRNDDSSILTSEYYCRTSFSSIWNGTTCAAKALSEGGINYY